MNKMVKTKGENNALIQLELFQATGQINISDLYNAIPKSINKSLSEKILWEGQLAHALVVPFQLEKSSPIHNAIISPATVLQEDGTSKSMFPEFREDQIEDAIIGLIAKSQSNVVIDHDDNKNVKHIITLSPYQIQKEINEAIYKREGRRVDVKNCRYSAKDIREALKILRGSNISVLNEDGTKEYDFSRIKELGIDDTSGKFIIEVSTFVTNSINEGDYFSYAFQGLLAPSDEVETSLVKYLYRKFNWASKGGKPFGIYASTLMDEINYTGQANSISIKISKFVKKIESIPEIEKILIGEVQKQGRKVVDKMLYIFPSDYFVDSVINSNLIGKRVENHIVTHQGELLLEPNREDYPTETAYKQALKEYGKNRAKNALHNS